MWRVYLLALLELLRSLLLRTYRLSRAGIAVAAIALVFFSFSSDGLAGFSWYFWTPGDTVDDAQSTSLTGQGYMPDQPIPFSHKLHAGDKQIPCQYCHSSARRSITSGIPSANTCMGCHRFVKTDSPHIKFITEKYNNNEPVEWVKVHDLPDFVRFSHKVHVSAAGLECQECHGAVETMEIVEQHAPLQMGWCLECHREKGASTECLTCHY